MENEDNISLSLKEANDLMNIAYESQKIFAEFDQAQVDRVIASMARAGMENAHHLAKMAVDETGMGVLEDKIIKNEFASGNVYEFIKGMNTVGIIKEDKEHKVVEIAAPMGVVVGIIPTTNPTSTILYKAMIALKSRNAIVFSPHPRAIKCCMEAARLMEKAAADAGAPKGLVNCLAICTKEATTELMKHKYAAVILATGGSAMVKAAYSSGTPALGVGPGNVPAFIERSADIPDAVQKIIKSKTFDNGTICASEQAVVTELIIAEKVITELKKQGAYLVSGSEMEALEKTVIQQNGGVNPDVVGQSPQRIADLAGIKIPAETKVMIALTKGVGKDYPLSAEKLCPVLALYIEKDWRKACERCFELLSYGGLGHSLVIHSQNDEVIREFAMKKPVFRILVNTPSSLGAIGYSTGLAPALTLGCGTWGGSITSDNVTPLHLMNIKRIAYHLEKKSKTSETSQANYCYTKAEILKAMEHQIRK